MAGTHRLRRLLPPLLVLACFTGAWKAEAYVIYLKDGSRLIARERPVAQGANYVFLSTSGNRQMIPVSEVDEKKTEAHNSAGYGDSYIMTDAPDQKGPEAPVSNRSLSDVIRNKKITIRDSAVPGRAAPEDLAPVRPTPVPAKGSLVKIGGQAQAASQNVDPQVNDAFTRALETAGVKRAQLVPAGGVLRVQAVVDSEQQVFAALGAVARGLKESRALGKSIERAEIVLSTSTAENAGRFMLTADDADALLNGKISAAKYFVASVIF